MEPLFFKAENKIPGQRAPRTEKRFNGAAFFQSGKSDCLLGTLATIAQLQWSRFFSKRKIR